MMQDSTKQITLSQLAGKVGGAINSSLPGEMWVVAEISECKVAAAGHCYLSLVERADGAAMPIAEMRAAIWANRYRAIATDFKAQTGGSIQAGMKLLMRCAVSFHPVYGLSLVISDIDPTYTLGEGERLRQLTIEKLKADGIFDMQKGVELPPIVQRIAVVSSATAAGYEDFIKQINSSVYRFEIELFAASMQGEQTERTVIEALDNIAEHCDRYDVVVIIRGGGSASDLRWFDSYNLASNVAQFPLPIFTGIGHEKDISVVDMVAHTMHKTPTAVAAALVAGLQTVDDYLQNAINLIIHNAQQRILGETARVERMAHNLRSNTIESMKNAAVRLEKLSGALRLYATQYIIRRADDMSRLKIAITTIASQILERQSAHLALLGEQIKSKNPRSILKMGYSIIRNDSGKSIKSRVDAPSGTTLNVELYDGTVKTIVK